MLDQQLAMTTRVMQHRPLPINVNLQIVYLNLAGKPTESANLMKKAFIVYHSDFSKLACYWKTVPIEEIRRLWVEAERLTEGTLTCGMEMKKFANPSS